MSEDEKKNKNKIKDLNFFSFMLNNKKNLISLSEEGKISVNKTFHLLSKSKK